MDFTIKELAMKFQMNRQVAGNKFRNAIDDFKKFLDQIY
jgi:hypothetical protein